MKYRSILALAAVPLIFTGCMQSNEPELTPEEQEHNALVEWFETGMANEDKFPDLPDYRYYARTIGLDKDGLIQPDMWEIFYNENININREIDGKAIYLIRLDPNKLMEKWAENNESTPEEICAEIGTTPDELYYNFGYTSNSINYAKDHKSGKVSYSDVENEIFGPDNGEDRSIVFGTHFLYIDTSGKYKVTYESENDDFSVRQRDILKATSEVSHNYSDYAHEEIYPGYFLENVGIRRVLKLDIPNLWSKSVEKDIDTDASLMFNMSPYSYGCTKEDIINLYADPKVDEMTETSESEVSE